MGHPPPDKMTLSKVPRKITPTIVWSGAQYDLNSYKLGGKIAVVEPNSYTPVGASHIIQWMSEHGQAMAKHRHQGHAKNTAE
eukprot:12341335-Karenia_brevis.AAC.1